MMVWGFCSTQAFGPNVVTGHGPCRERVLLWGESTQQVSQQAARGPACAGTVQTVLDSEMSSSE